MKQLFGSAWSVGSAIVSGIQGRPPLDITMVTDRIYAMPFPCDSKAAVNSGPCTDIHAVSAFLKKKHGQGKAMVWNLSEKSYNYELFDNQVIEFNFPGHPTPPLEVMLEIMRSIDKWLNADAGNVAVVHCMTSLVRTATVIACYCRYTKRVNDAMVALRHYYSIRKVSKREDIFVPSQLRHIKYFNAVLMGFNPHPNLLKIRSISMNSVPKFLENGRCRPVIQIYKDGCIIFSSASQKTQLKTYSQTDIPIYIVVDTIVSGDILIRAINLSAPLSEYNDMQKKMVEGRMVSELLFRFTFHTAFIDYGILKVKRKDLDGPHYDSVRFSSDFCLDIDFEVCVNNNVLNVPVTSEGRIGDAEWERWREESRNNRTGSVDVPSFGVGDDVELPSDEKKVLKDCHEDFENELVDSINVRNCGSLDHDDIEKEFGAEEHNQQLMTAAHRVSGSEYMKSLRVVDAKNKESFNVSTDIPNNTNAASDGSTSCSTGISTPYIIDESDLASIERSIEASCDGLDNLDFELDDDLINNDNGEILNINPGSTLDDESWINELEKELSLN